MLTRRPVPRPWDVIALELLLTIASAIQVGLLLWLAVATWDERAAPGVVIGVLVLVAMAVGAGWFLWLTGMNGWLLAGASGVAGLEVAFLLVLGAAGEVIGVSALVLLLSLGASILGVACGIFLPAPSSRRYQPTPRERETAGGPPSAPKVSPAVAAAAERYAKPVVAGAVAVTAAGARKVSRPTGGAAGTGSDTGVSVLTPRAGTPIRTSGPVDPDAMRTPGTTPPGTTPPGTTPPGTTPPGTTPPGTTPPRPGTPGVGTPAASTPAAGVPTPNPVMGMPPRSTTTPTRATSAPGTPATPATATPAGGTPAKGTTTRSGTRSGGPPPDPGAIARQARASIDAELAKPRGGRIIGPSGSKAASPPPRTPPPASPLPPPAPMPDPGYDVDPGSDPAARR